MKMRPLENNLRNIRNTNTIFNIVANNILANLPPQDTSLHPELLKILAGDTYFLHYSVYPMLIQSNPNQTLEKIRTVFDEYMKTKEYQNARVLTVLDDEISRVFTYSLIAEILKKLKEEIQNLMQNQELGQGGGQGQQNPQGQPQQGQDQFQQSQSQSQNQQSQSQNQNQPQSQSQQSQSSQQNQNQQGQGQDQSQPQQIPQEIVEKALQNVFNLQNLQEAEKNAEKDAKNFSIIRHFAGKTGTSFNKTLNLLNQIRKTKGEQILSFGSKLSFNILTHVKKSEDKHGDEIGGYALTHNPLYALPRELALPDDLFYSKLSSSGLLMKQKLSIAEGDYYVLLDKSSSMTEGNKTVWSRSVALSILNVSKLKGRKYFLRFFDTEVHPLLTKPDEILECLLTVECDGGTDITKAIMTAVSDLSKLGSYTNTIIIITDGEDTVNLTKQHLRNNKLISIMIEGHNETLKMLSTLFYKVEPDEKNAQLVLSKVV